jgi:transmembrane sensor
MSFSDDETLTDDATLEQAAHWLSHLKGAAPNGARDAELQAWLARDPRHAAALDLMLETWEASAPLAQTPIVRSELEGIERRSAARRRRSRMRLWAPVGGLVAAGVALAILVFPPARDHVYRTAVGEIASVTLGDHSRVWLDTHSTVEVALSPLRRDVRLEQGAAEFQVAHDAARPFVVSTPEADVRATGTDFSVRRDAGATRVVLAQGAVIVTRRADGAQTLMHAGQALRLPATGPSTLTETDPQSDLAWRDGRLVFYRRPLSEVVAEFARYGAQPVRFADPAAGRVTVSGTYRAKDFAYFLKAMSAIYGLRFHTDNKAEIIARSRG